MNMHIHQLNVSNALCYANIDVDVYMAPTPDFDLPTGHCFKFEKSYTDCIVRHNHGGSI